MTTPDFIWAKTTLGNTDEGYWDGSPIVPNIAANQGTPYVRDDPDALVQSANVQALIAAAVEEAAGWLQSQCITEDELRQGYIFTPEYPAKAADTIREMFFKADHKAALDRLLQAAKNEALREAAAVADDYEHRWNAAAYDRRQAGKDDNFACASASASTRIAIAIRALIQEPPQ
jgi:hypothetical protein